MPTAQLEDGKSRTTLPLPDYFSAKGMLRDKRWVEAYMSTVLQWPKTCALPTRDRQLIGLAKSLAFSWEPGILNHTDLALNTGSTPEEVTEVIKATAIAIGLSQLDKTLRALPRAGLDSAARSALRPVREFLGSTPSLFRRRIIFEDRPWFQELLQVALPAFDSRPGAIKPRLRALVCLAAAAVTGWEEGIRLYSRAATRFGATASEVSDVIKSVFKTAVSNSMAAGFRTPCHIPRLENYRTILSAYVEKGALVKEKKDPLTTSSQSRRRSRSSS